MTMVFILTEQQLKEISFTKHATDNIEKRVVSLLDDSDKKLVLNNIKKLQSIILPNSISVGVKLGDLSKTYNAKDKTKGWHSNGNQVWGIIRNNTLKTIYLARKEQFSNKNPNDKLRTNYYFDSVKTLNRNLKNIFVKYVSERNPELLDKIKSMSPKDFTPKNTFLKRKKLYSESKEQVNDYIEV